MVLWRQEKRRAVFLSAGFFGWRGVLSLSFVLGWRSWRGVCLRTGLTRRTKGLFYVRRSRPPPSGQTSSSSVLARQVVTRIAERAIWGNLAVNDRPTPESLLKNFFKRMHRPASVLITENAHVRRRCSRCIYPHEQRTHRPISRHRSVHPFGDQGLKIGRVQIHAGHHTQTHRHRAQTGQTNRQTAVRCHHR